MSEKILHLQELATMVKGEIVGDQDLMISGFGPLETAQPGQISFLAKAAAQDMIMDSQASAFLVPMDITESSKTIIRVQNPYLAAAIIQNYLLQKPFVAEGIHTSAVLGSGGSISEELSIGACAVIGDGVTLGDRVAIGPGVVIGNDAIIGNDCVIKANVSIDQGCEIGNRVIIHSGTVIGSDGYGYATDNEGVHIKRPQLGKVKIGDDVEIGANCCIDRATFGVTWIKSGTKIDNLVQVAHNVIIGENSLIVAQVGLAGSTTLGRNVIFGGQSGASGHLSVGDGTMVAGMAAVHGDQPAGSVLAGIPAIPAKKWFKAAILFGKLPEIIKDLKKLKKEVAQLTRKDGSE
jgi:UDP-3-O-[3-hydroxymyristoyl] glucosamine N-acyltransferase